MLWQESEIVPTKSLPHWLFAKQRGWQGLFASCGGFVTSVAAGHGWLYHGVFSLPSKYLQQSLEEGIVWHPAGYNCFSVDASPTSEIK